MENLILAFEAPTSVVDVAALLSERYRVDQVDDDRYLIESAKGRLWIDGWSDIRTEYAERPAPMHRLQEPSLVAINYSRGIELARAVALLVTRRLDCVVDTDHGLVIDGSGFADLLERYPSWDWRLDHDPRLR